MKIRTQYELLDRLDNEFSWRLRELTTVWSDVQSAPEKSCNVRMRSGIALLYAHWEGFIKAAGDLFINYIKSKRLKHSQLAAGFLSLALRQRLNEFSERKSVRGHIDFVSFIMNELESRANIRMLDAIKTGANLNSERLKDIVLTLGLDYSVYELKEKLIDTQLLSWRNNIAHGKVLTPTKSDFDFLYQEITGLLRIFKDQVENAVVLEEYLCKPSSAQKQTEEELSNNPQVSSGEQTANVRQRKHVW